MSRNSAVAVAYTGLTLVVMVGLFAPCQNRMPLPWEARVGGAIARSSVWGLASSCLREEQRRDSVSSRRDLIRAVTMAVAGVESYGRPPWIQSVKFALARAYYAATERLPNISLGLGQMKPKTAAYIVVSANPERAPSQEEIWRRLRVPCESVALVSLYFDQRLLELDDQRWRSGDLTARAEVMEAVKRYNGQGRDFQRAEFEINDLYSAVVLSLVEREMRQGLGQTDSQTKKN